MRLAHLRIVCFLWLGLFLLAAVPTVTAQQIDSIYGPLPVFEFHSGFWVNLHHFLYHEAKTRELAKDAREAFGKSAVPGLKPKPGLQPSLSPAEQKIWEDAITYYTANYTNKNLLINIDLILLKDQLGDFEDCDELTGKKQRVCDAGLPGRAGVLLESVAPIYRAYWWPGHDRANRRWVARVAPLVREQGVGLSERLADIYQTKWPKQKIRVEVSAYANTAGAYTTLDPLRVTIASLDSRNQGPEALEVLFLEASHSIAIPVENAISRECKQRDIPIPRDLWHALIFYTTAEVLRPVMQDSSPDSASPDSSASQKSSPSTVPFMLQERLTQRGWEDYHLRLSLYWQPYLDNKVTFEDAIAHLVSSL